MASTAEMALPPEKHDADSVMEQGLEHLRRSLSGSGMLSDADESAIQLSTEDRQALFNNVKSKYPNIGWIMDLVDDYFYWILIWIVLQTGAMYIWFTVFMTDLTEQDGTVRHHWCRIISGVNVNNEAVTCESTFWWNIPGTVFMTVGALLFIRSYVRNDLIKLGLIMTADGDWCTVSPGLERCMKGTLVFGFMANNGVLWIVRLSAEEGGLTMFGLVLMINMTLEFWLCWQSLLAVTLTFVAVCGLLFRKTKEMIASVCGSPSPFNKEDLEYASSEVELNEKLANYYQVNSLPTPEQGAEGMAEKYFHDQKRLNAILKEKYGAPLFNKADADAREAKLINGTPIANLQQLIEYHVLLRKEIAGFALMFRKLASCGCYISGIGFGFMMVSTVKDRNQPWPYLGWDIFGVIVCSLGILCYVSPISNLNHCDDIFRLSVNTATKLLSFETRMQFIDYLSINRPPYVIAGDFAITRGMLFSFLLTAVSTLAFTIYEKLSGEI